MLFIFSHGVDTIASIGYLWEDNNAMGKLLSRAAAAKMLDCAPQTVSNYVSCGLIDEVRRPQNGRDTLLYDEDQLSALVPHLKEMGELEERVARQKQELIQEQQDLAKAREKARKEFLRVSGGQRTFNRFRQLAMVAYDYAGPVNPHADRFTAKVLEKLLSLEDFDTVCKELQASPYKVDTAISRIAHRMYKMRNIVTEINAIRREQKMVLDENARLREENARLRGVKKETTTDVQEDERLLSFRAVTIKSLPLSTRTQGVLTRGGVETLYDLAKYGSQDLKKIYGLGNNGLREIEEMLRSFGLSERR